MSCEICNKNDGLFASEPAIAAVQMSEQKVCVDCVVMAHCNDCGERFDQRECFLGQKPWHLGDPLLEFCDECSAKNDKIEQEDESFFVTIDTIERESRTYGWDCRLNSVASTGTHYFDLKKYAECDECSEKVTVRVADHGSVYCGEDFSLATKNATPDDHSIKDLISRLRKTVECEC